MTDRDRLSLRGAIKSCEIHRVCPSNGQGRDFETRELVEFRPDGLFQKRYFQNPPPSADWATVYEYDKDSGQLSEERVDICGVVTLVKALEYDSSRRLSRVMESDANGLRRVAETYSYERGVKRKKITHFGEELRRVQGFGVDGTDVAYGAPGAATLTSKYDEHGKPVEHLFHDDAEELITRVVFGYDDRDNLIEEVCTQQHSPPAEVLANFTAEQLEAFRQPHTFRRRHRYDAQNRRIETSLEMSPFHSDKRTFAYNDYGDVISEISESSQTDYEVSEEGTLNAKTETTSSHRSEALVRYQYDSHGNWIEKIVEAPGGPTWSTERRTITYFDANVTR